MLVSKTMYYLIKPQVGDKPDLYYVGGGVWSPKLSDRILIRLYENRKLADVVAKANLDAEIKSAEIMVK